MHYVLENEEEGGEGIVEKLPVSMLRSARSKKGEFPHTRQLRYIPSPNSIPKMGVRKLPHAHKIDEDLRTRPPSITELKYASIEI